ncbi:hypothetical protein [Methanomicrobium mobile]|uniref:hypothetical protein n=1 Tax=Methanomicrobium mobile TaxID=2205 RepID=UPI0012F6382E|nr:hypothetical protein [Methanomicrobium mobile]
MRITTSHIPLILSLMLLLISFAFPISALELSEEKTIFVSDDAASPRFVIDAGNIFILDLYFDKYANKNKKQDDEWSKLYFYNISTDKLAELTFDDMSNTKANDPIAISGNTVYWTVNSDYRSYDTDIRSYDIVSKSYNRLSVPPSHPIELYVQDKTISLLATKFPDDIDGPNICISTDAGENFKRYRLPGHQSGGKNSGNIVVFGDSRYGQMRKSVHYLNIDTGESYQIGDETKGVYTYPDISGTNIVYRFDSDFYSYLKGLDVNQELYVTDISTDKTSLIASPNARINVPAIDKDYIVWCDNRNKPIFKLYLYDLKENKEYYVADINDEYGAAPLVSKNTIVWSDNVDNKNVLKIVTIHDENYIDDGISGNSGTDDMDNTGNSENSQPQNTNSDNAQSQTASGEAVFIIAAVCTALFAKALYQRRNDE